MAIESRQNSKIWQTLWPQSSQIKDKTSRELWLETASWIDYFKSLFKDVLWDKIPINFFEVYDPCRETERRINAFSAREQLTKLVTKYDLYPEREYLRELVDLGNKIQRIDFQQLDTLIEKWIKFSSIEAVTDLVDQELDHKKIEQYAQICKNEGYVIKNWKLLTKKWDTNLELIQELIDNHIIENRSNVDYMTTPQLQKLKYMTEKLNLSSYDICGNLPKKHYEGWCKYITNEKIDNYQKICSTLWLEQRFHDLESINIQDFHIENFEAIRDAWFSIKSMTYTWIKYINKRSQEEIQDVIKWMQWLRDTCHVTKFWEYSDTSRVHPLFYLRIFEKSSKDHTSISERCKDFYEKVWKQIKERGREITDGDVMDYNKTIEYNLPSF